MVVRTPTVEVRLAFRLGNWLNRLRRRHRKWFLLHTNMDTVNVLVKAVIQSISDEELNKIEEESSNHWETDALALLKPFIKYNNKGVEVGETIEILSAIKAHAMKYPMHVPASETGCYVLEAIANGTRILTLRHFMHIWYIRRRESIAWRPLFSVTRNLRPVINMEVVAPFVGMPYPSLCAVVVAGFRISRRNKKLIRGSYLCSAVVGAIFQRLGILSDEVSPDNFMPADFADESSHLSVNTYLLRSWLFGRIVYIGKSGDDTKEDGRIRRRLYPDRVTNLGLNGDQPNESKNSTPVDGVQINVFASADKVCVGLTSKGRIKDTDKNKSTQNTNVALV